MNRISSKNFQTFLSEEEKMRHEAIYGQIIGAKSGSAAAEDVETTIPLKFQFEGNQVQGISFSPIGSHEQESKLKENGQDLATLFKFELKTISGTIP